MAGCASPAFLAAAGCARVPRVVITSRAYSDRRRHPPPPDGGEAAREAGAMMRQTPISAVVCSSVGEEKCRRQEVNMKARTPINRLADCPPLPLDASTSSRANWPKSRSIGARAFHLPALHEGDVPQRHFSLLSVPWLHWFQHPATPDSSRGTIPHARHVDVGLV